MQYVYAYWTVPQNVHISAVATPSSNCNVCIKLFQVRKGYNLRSLIPNSLAESPSTGTASQHYLQYHNPTPQDDDNYDYIPPSQQSSSSGGSQGSMEDIGARLIRENLQHDIFELASDGGIDVSAIRFAKDFRNLSPETQRKRIQVVRQFVSLLCDIFAQGDSAYLEHLLYSKHRLDPTDTRNQAKIDGVMERHLEAFQNAPTAIARQQSLSLIAPFFPLSEIQVYLPGLSSYYYTRARLFAKMYKPGVPPPQLQAKRERVSRRQIAAVIDFITNPAIVVDLPCGTATVTSSSGGKEEIPRVLRTQVNERIAQQYLAYMKEMGLEAVSRSTILRILDYCTATTRKSLQGLDFFAWAGSEGFDALIRITNSLGNYAEDPDWAKDTVRLLKESKQYLKMDYRMHLKGASRIPDHCLAYALSNPDDKDFAQPCGHQHDLRCDRCEMLQNVLRDIQQRIDSTTFETDFEKEELLYDYSNAANDIRELKKHIVRTVRQDQARNDTLSRLEPNDVYIQMDWAMKFLPISGREPQADWFGKRGIPWHITHVTARDATGKSYRTRLYVHVFPTIAQDAYAVLAVLDDVLHHIHSEMPRVERAYLRSDNAGCYKSAVAITAIPKLSATHEISVRRWDFSEAQSGKGACDRASALVKKNVRLYAAENHKCTNAEEFVACADSYNGVRSATIVHGQLNVQKPAAKPKIPLISSYNNFQFEDNGEIIEWQAYKIGPGKKPRNTWSDSQYLPRMSTLSMRTQGEQHAAAKEETTSWKDIGPEPKQVSVGSCNGDDDGCDDDDSAPSNQYPTLFPCPEQGCIKIYQRQSYLDWHLENGKHQYKPERLSLRDAAIGAYKAQLEGVRLPQTLPSVRDALQSFAPSEYDPPTALKIGWALRTRRKGAPFSAEIRSYLTEKFNEGQTSGRKLDPRTIAKSMRQQFPQDKWLTWGQIASYWSRLARVARKEPLDDLAYDDDDDDQQGNIGYAEDLVEDPYFNNIEYEIYDAVEENASNIYE